MPEHPALTNDTSMLTRRFGKEVINYFSGSRLNRYSFLRSDVTFLNRVATSPHARYIALDNLSPLVVNKKKLALLSYQDIKSVLGPHPTFLQSDAERIKAFDSSKVASETQVLFLGTTTTKNGAGVESEVDADENDVVWETSEHGDVRGRPYFAVDVSTTRGERKEEKKAWLKSQEEKGLWIASDTRSLTLHSEAGMCLLSLFILMFLPLFIFLSLFLFLGLLCSLQSLASLLFSMRMPKLTAILMIH